MNKILLNALMGVFLYSFQLAAAQGTVSTHSFKSSSLGRNISYNVYLPPSYEQATTSYYPVLYLFHGKGGRYFDWANNTHAADTLNKQIANGAKEMLVVMPDGLDSWYINKSMEWERFFYNELIPSVQDSFRVGTNKQSRAIAGLSMGGWGTTYHWITKGAELYSSAYCLSGALGVREGIDIEVMMNALSDAEKMALPPYKMEIGTEDHLYNRNVSWHNFLKTIEIEHGYIERPGTHDWKFWAECLSNVVWFASEHFGEVVVSVQNSKVSNDFSVYPNPANDYVILNVPNAKSNTARYSIFTGLGQTVLWGDTAGEDLYRFDISSLASGMYFVDVRCGKNNSNVKLIVK